MSLVDALARVGVAVRVLNEPQIAGVGPDVPCDPDVHADMVLHIGPPPWRRVEGKRNLAIAWWPFSEMPPEWKSALYTIDGLIVPSQWCADGVTMPRPDQAVHIVPFGVDPAVFQPVERTRGDVLKIVTFDTHAERYSAGTDIAMRAFKEAFFDRDDVVLEVWSSQTADIETGDERIRLRRGVGDDSGLARLYRQADALLYSSRGEGAALVALEAMASGVPVIHSGLTAMSRLLEYGETVGSRTMVVPLPIHPSAVCYEPYVEQLADKLRDLDRNYERWQKRAHDDAASVAERFSWERSARALVDVLEGRHAVSEPGLVR